MPDGRGILQGRKVCWCKQPCREIDCLLYKRIEVPYIGNPVARVVFVGESPGRTELEKGKPFVGDAGDLLYSTFTKVGINAKECFIINSARCLIDKKKLGMRDIASILHACRPKVEKALHTIKPRLIVVLGDIALRQIMKKAGISKHRGVLLYSQEFNCDVYPMFHPAHILRNKSMLPRFLGDMKVVKEIIDNDFKEVKIIDSLKYESDNVPMHTLSKLVSGNTIGIDTETQGLDWCSEDFLVISFSISHAKGCAHQINLYKEVSLEKADFVIKWRRKPEGKKWAVVDVGVKREEGFDKKILFLKSILTSEKVKKYMMSPYDMYAFHALFKRENIKLGEIKNFAMDIQAAANIYDENLYKMTSLSILQKDFTEIKKDYNAEFEDTFDKADMLKAKNVSRETFNEYACYDADVTRRAGVALKNIFLRKPNSRQANYFVKFTMPTIRKTLFEISKNGIKFDTDNFPETRTEIKDMLDRMEKKALKYVPHGVIEKYSDDLKLSRSDILRDALYSDIGYGLPILKSNKTGPSVDEKTRVKLLDIKGLSNQAKECILRYNEYKETHTLYTRNLKNFDEHVKRDGRIHTKVNLVAAVTGRVASSSPNLMSIPKRSKLAPRVRKLLCAPKGYVLIAPDAAQAELRWIAHVSQDKAMIEVFNKGQDIHTATAMALVGDKWSTLSKEEQKIARRNAKVVNFGLIYGMHLNGFLDYAKAEYGVTLSRVEGERWINIFFNKYSRLPLYHRNTIAECQKHGYVESCYGRRRRLPDILSKDKFLRGYAERQAINHKIQSPSSDTVLMSANDFIDQGYPKKEARVVLFIHDELIFEVREDLADKYVGRIKYHMENPPIEKTFGVKLSVPLKADIKVGPNLKDLEEVE